MATVSVVVPTYNHRDYVLQTLDSVFAQSFTDYEVIVVNDGSPDDTTELLRPLAERGRIHYIEQTNAGQAHARNRGLAEATGEFIAFLDDDDLWPPDKLAWQTQFLQTNDAVLIGGSVTSIQEDSPEKHHPQEVVGKIVKSDLAGGSPFYSPGQTLIRHATLKVVGGFDASIWGVDDHDLYLRLEPHGTLYVEERVSLYYRLHSANASKQRGRMLANGFKVARRHFSEIGSPNYRKVHRWLYDYAGREQINAIKQALRMGDVQAALAHYRSLAPFIEPAKHDGMLAKMIGWDLLPKRFAKNAS